jgi:molybdopterin-containing oxidoreductase family membrane subunit
MAEVITVMVLFIGAGQILIDLGRPDRFMNVIYYGRYQSPLLWDATSISAYLTASTFYLYLPLIPDIAILRDHLGGKRRFLYAVLSLGWTGTERQQKILNRAIAIMAVLVIPIAVSVHTVVSFVFSMTIQPAWHSSIFGPYFVVGAIFSGIAALIVAMAVIRRIYHFEGYLKPIHFRYLGYLLLVMTLLWFYLTFAEYLTGYYGNEPEEMKVFWSKFTGRYWPTFWAMVVLNLVIPLACLVRLRHHAVGKTVVASVAIVIGMWLERFNIVVPTLSNPRLPFPEGQYWPTWIEWGETAGSFGLFILFYVIFVKLFPIISIWEVREGRDVGLKEVEERLLTYLPDAPEPERAPDSARVPT